GSRSNRTFAKEITAGNNASVTRPSRGVTALRNRRDSTSHARRAGSDGRRRPYTPAPGPTQASGAFGVSRRRAAVQAARYDHAAVLAGARSVASPRRVAPSVVRATA